MEDQTFLNTSWKSQKHQSVSNHLLSTNSACVLIQCTDSLLIALAITVLFSHVYIVVHVLCIIDHSNLILWLDCHL